MTRHEAESKILEHLAEIVKIAQQYDPDTNYISIWAFAKSNAGMVVNNKSGAAKLEAFTEQLVTPHE